MLAFKRKLSAPRAKHRSRSFRSLRLENTMIFVSLKRASARIFSSTSKPSILGIIISKIIRSGTIVHPKINCIASTPSPAVYISYHSSFSFNVYISDKTTLSSATKIVAFIKYKKSNIRCALYPNNKYIARIVNFKKLFLDGYEPHLCKCNNIS